jgi:type II secretory pathway pseudopilin PulG
MKTIETHKVRSPAVRGLFAAGLGLVELLIALAIMAMLLTSVAAAFHASLATVDQNQKIATVTQVSRITLHRIMAEARRGIVAETAAHSVSIQPPEDGRNLDILKFELVNGTLLYHQTDIHGVTTDYTLLSSADGVVVRDFAVSWEDGKDSEGLDCTKDITARLDLEVDGNRFTVTASTNPRRNLQW